MSTVFKPVSESCSRENTEKFCLRLQRPFAAISFITFLLFLSLGLAEGCGGSKDVNVTKMNLSVQEFESRAGVSPNESQKIADRIGTLLERTGHVALVDRKQALGLKKKQLNSTLTPEEQRNAREIKVLPIRKLVFGSVGKLGDRSYSIVVRMVDVESSSVDIAVTKIYNGQLENISNNFLEGIVGQLVSVIESPSRE
jgi:hypothetical protein